LYYRALAYSGQNKFDDAIRDLVAAKSGNPDAVNVRMHLAALYKQTQHYGEAALEYSDTIKAHPQNFALRVEYADFLLGLFKMEKNFPQEGGIEFVDNIRQMGLKARLISLITDSQEQVAPGYWLLVYAQVQEVDDNQREALRLFRRAVEVNGANIDLSLHQMFFRSLLANGLWEETIDRSTPLFNNPEVKQFIEKNPELATLYLKRAKA